ncbi:transposable element Tcb2 transposase [Trichonephila clavipes]|nr:transposable element Tcb2 transposase [Trichonephila clavipes]
MIFPHVHLFRGAIGPDFIFMDENARPHRTADIQQLLESENITQINWPQFSLDLNSTEHAWNTLEKHLTTRLHLPRNTQQLKQLLIEEWALLPQELLDNLELSIKRRCEAIIAVRGGHIPY